MSVPNFRSLAGLEVAEKFVVVEGVVEHLATVSNSKKVDLELLWVELSYVGFWQQISGQLL